MMIPSTSFLVIHPAGADRQKPPTWFILFLALFPQFHLGCVPFACAPHDTGAFAKLTASLRCDFFERKFQIDAGAVLNFDMEFSAKLFR